MAKASHSLAPEMHGNSAIAAAAAEIHALINSKPHSPSRKEIATVIARAALPPVDRVGVPAGAPFEPIRGPDGKTLTFDYTNIGFCDQYLPWVRMAFVLMGFDQAAFEKYLRDLAQADGGEEDVEALLDGLQTVHAKFSAIGKFADIVLARLVIAGNAIVTKEQTAGRAAQ